MFTIESDIFALSCCVVYST